MQGFGCGFSSYHFPRVKMEATCIAVLVLTLVARSYSVNYTWDFYPIANRALYGYDQVANLSFKSADVPDGVKTQIEDGIQALYVPAGKEIDLGDFAGTCVSNATKCLRFSVSFLLKTSAEETLKIFDSGSKYGDTEEWGWLFEINDFKDYNAEVRAGNNFAGNQMKSPSVGGWLHAGFVYDQTRCCPATPHVFINGTQSPYHMSAMTGEPQDKNTHLKLGDKSNTVGFFVSNFQFLEAAYLDLQQIQELGNRSFVKAMQVYNVTVEVLKKNVSVRGDAGKVQIPLKRTGDLDVAVPVGFSTVSGTATASKHFTPATNQQLAFAPGETYKHLEVAIADNEGNKVNKTFKVTFNSPENWVVLDGPREVDVTIMYSGEAEGPTSDATCETRQLFLSSWIVVLFSIFCLVV